jgi:hypothetical protein
VPAQPSYGAQESYAYQEAPQADPYGYPQQYGGQDPYGYQQADPYAYQGYEAPQGAQESHRDAQGGNPQGGPQAGSQGNHQGYALDETSLFDTSMISAEQLRQYEQRYGQGR